MKKIIFAMIFILLIGCSDDNLNEDKNNINNESISNEVKSISKNNITEQEEPIEDITQEEVEPFWEVYGGVELADAVSSGEKVYNFEAEAPLFEDALIESLSANEDRDWTPYLTSFNANIRNQAPDGYVHEMNQAHLAVLEDNLDLEKAIEHVKEAKRIRENTE